MSVSGAQQMELDDVQQSSGAPSIAGKEKKRFEVLFFIFQYVYSFFLID